jgi:nuclear pore complex protein Nup155
VPTDIRNTWRLLLEHTHEQSVNAGELQPYEAIADLVRTLGRRINLSETTFPLADLLPILKRYSVEQQRDLGSPTWVVDCFLDLGVPCEDVFRVLEGMLHNDEMPFQGSNRRFVADDMLYVAARWFQESGRGITPVMGGEENAAAVAESLLVAMQRGMSHERIEECGALRAKILELAR